MLFGLFVLSFLAIGCDQSGTATSTPPPASTQPAAGGGSGEKKFTIGMSQANLGEPWRVQMNADVKAEADKHSNITMVFKDASRDSLKQRAHVEEFVSQGVNLLIISPNEAQPLTEPIAKALEAGIPVIVLDRR
jgi:ribose transport system substrate-binding protein